MRLQHLQLIVKLSECVKSVIDLAKIMQLDIIYKILILGNNILYIFLALGLIALIQKLARRISVDFLVSFNFFCKFKHTTVLYLQ